MGVLLADIGKNFHDKLGDLVGGFWNINSVKFDQLNFSYENYFCMLNCLIIKLNIPVSWPFIPSWVAHCLVPLAIPVAFQVVAQCIMKEQKLKLIPI